MPSRLRAAVAALLITATATVALPAAADAQATRTWVSGVGDDVNPCSRTAPCKTFAGAISKTAAEGEINVLDPGGFGAVTITKAITIAAEGFEGGVLTNAANAINVSAPATSDVVLRGLDIEGLGTATNAVRVNSARSVTLADSIISGFAGAGVSVANAAGNVDVFVDGVDMFDIRDNDDLTTLAAGIDLVPGAGGSADLLAKNVDIHDAETGIRARDRGHVWLTGSTIFDNIVGLETVGDGKIDSANDTMIVGNDTDVATGGNVTQEPRAVTQTVTTPAPPPTTVTVTQTVTAPPTTPAPIVLCVVPKLTGLTLAAAKTKLVKANCAAGRVTRRRTKASRVGRVLSQDTKTGTKANKGAKVALIVGKK